MEHCHTESKEGCCKDLETKNENLKGGEFKMMIKKKTLLWITIGFLFLTVIYLTFKVNNLSVDSVQSATTQAASVGSAMVGGC